jgi:divalent metal cation (Fe/Co/Zn/Cd) transporter
MGASGLLAVLKITVGLFAGSAAVVSDGVESAADVLASGIVLFGLMLAAKPPDAEHPYGHGRVETLSGLAVGILLGITGAGICFKAALDARYRPCPCPLCHLAAHRLHAREERDERPQVPSRPPHQERSLSGRRVER